MNPFRTGLVLAIGGLLSCTLPASSPTKPMPSPPANEPRRLADQLAYYPRLIRLNHQKTGNGALLTAFDTDNNRAALFRSDDAGQTWRSVGGMQDRTANWHCCSGLWELPKTVGNVVAGTLFWAPSMGCPRDPRCPAAIRIQRSDDGGRTWQPHSTLVTGNVGLWEAEFIVDRAGNVVAFYSTEEHRAEGFNQLLAHRVSTDGGLTWGPEVRDVAVPDRPNQKMRPGMAIVRQLPDGTYAMVYEICGLGCDVFIRFSANGTDWGDPADPGTRIESTKGHHFAHAPSFTVLPAGRLLVVGQLLMDAAGHVAPDNGRVLMQSAVGGRGPWTEWAAPVPVPQAYDNPCPNYSSQVLPLDARTLLQVALRPDPAGCRPYVAAGPLPE